jgi:carotenoid cleavage dioxygenase-like enzyme
MNRRDLLRRLAAMAAAPLLAPELTHAAAQMETGAAAGLDWSLAFADLDADRAPSAMRLISGRCPEGLSGALYRNGPGKFRRAGGDVGHWFDGDGLMRAFRIEGGAARLQARFVDTPKRRADIAAGAVVTPGFGTVGSTAVQLRSADDTNAANISVIPVGDKLWALWEAGSPTAVDPASLATEGQRTLRADLAHMPFLAHPRREPGGDLWNLGMGGAQAVVWRLAPDGSVRSADLTDLPRASYVHDFTTTARHLIVILQPMIQDKTTLPFIDGFSWKPEQGVQILVLDKADLSRRRLYELPSFYAFHYGSAWEDAGGAIRFDVCASPNPDFTTRGAREVLRGVWTPTEQTRLAAITLGSNGKATFEPTGVVAEFPRGDGRFSERARRFSIHATADRGGPLFHGLATHDWTTGRSDAFDFGASHMVEEAVFTPRPGGSAELDGWLLAPSVNLTARATELHVFDARRVSEGPICTWRADHALPVSLHGVFVAV